MICHFDLINSLSYVVLSQAEIDQLVARLFDKGPPTAGPTVVKILLLR
jgi:hypothetical protein